MFLYGAFLTVVVVGMLLYQRGFFNNIPYFDISKKPKPDIAVKINNVEFHSDAVTLTIELENSELYQF